MDRQDVKFSIRKKILGVTLVAALPFLAISIYLLISMSNYNHTYNKIVQNLTIANNYNLDFKEEMDESLYKMVVGYVTVDDFDDAEELKSPYVLIKNLRKEFRNLKKITTDTESKLWLDSLLRNIDTLENRVDDLVQNIHVGGTYDSNIKELDDNIYILTELIQDDIQYYIYYQTESMEKVTDTLNTQIRTFIIICACLIAVLTIGLVMAVMQITTGMLRPIQVLAQAAGRISKGDLDARADVDSRDEIAVLADRFNDMAGNIQTLVVKVREDEQKMRKADLRLLQEQINPHFLYNTLDNIVWLIEGNEPDEAVEMVVTLSEFFRLVLSKGKEFITIRQEEQHIRSYLQIQEKRYHDILDYHIYIDPEIYEYQIPKLTLQPLVENALYHGIKYKRSRGMIEITGTKEGENLYLTVADDGVGMDEDELKKLGKEISRPCKETESGFGLANVNERIRMYFGAEFGMKIWSEKGSGTRITIEIPAITDNPEKPEEGSHFIEFSRELWMEREDFMEDAPKKYFRMTPGQEVRLKNAYIVKCTGCKKNEAGEIVEVYCEYDPNTKSGMPEANRKVKGTLHWVSCDHCLEAEVRLYDRLWKVENPRDELAAIREAKNCDALEAMKEIINPDSLHILPRCYIEKYAAGMKPLTYLQFQRIGYFNVDPDSTPEKMVFNRTVGLKDTWGKINK